MQQALGVWKTYVIYAEGVSRSPLSSQAQTAKLGAIKPLLQAT